MTDKRTEPEDFNASTLTKRLEEYILDETDRTEIINCLNNENDETPAISY